MILERLELLRGRPAALPRPKAVCFVECWHGGEGAADAAGFRTLCATAGVEGAVLAVNHAIAHERGRIDLAATLESRHLLGWVRARSRAGQNGDYAAFAAALVAGGQSPADFILRPGIKVPSSGAYGLLVALKLGYRAVCVNARLDGAYAIYRPGWLDLCQEFFGRVFHFSPYGGPSWVAEAMPAFTGAVAESLREAA